jgi:hypothetical protein
MPRVGSPSSNNPAALSAFIRLENSCRPGNRLSDVFQLLATWSWERKTANKEEAGALDHLWTTY